MHAPVPQTRETGGPEALPMREVVAQAHPLHASGDGSRVLVSVPNTWCRNHLESVRPKPEREAHPKCSKGYQDSGSANEPGGKSFPEPLGHCSSCS